MHIKSGNKSISSLKLSARLKVLAAMVEPCTYRIVDIGTDHAYLPIWLVGNNICKTAVASDLRSGPAERARRNVENYMLADRITIKTGDGLSSIELLPDDLVIIAGMGGLEIERILNSAQLPRGMRLLLQPQKSVPELRGWLDKNGYCILEEKIVIDRGHFYTIIKTSFTADYSECKSKMSLADLWLGPKLTNQFSRTVLTNTDSEIWQKYLKYLNNMIVKISIGRPELREVLDKISEYRQQAGKEYTDAN